MIKYDIYDYGYIMGVTLSFNNKKRAVRGLTKCYGMRPHVSMKKKVIMVKALKKAMFK